MLAGLGAKGTWAAGGKSDGCLLARTVHLLVDKVKFKLKLLLALADLDRLATDGDGKTLVFALELHTGKDSE